MSTPNLKKISLHLNCPINKINLENWQYVYFVRVPGFRPTFLSKKKFSIVKEKPITDFHASDYLNSQAKNSRTSSPNAFLNQFLTMTFDSSCLRDGSYSKDTNTLSLRFHSGSTYDYYSVPLIIWQELTKSYVSPGKAYNQLIKGRYRVCRVA